MCQTRSIDGLTTTQITDAIRASTEIAVESWEAYAVLTLVQKFPSGVMMLGDDERDFEVSWTHHEGVVKFSADE